MMFFQTAFNLLKSLNIFRGKEDSHMSWDYRVVRKTSYSLGKAYHNYGIHEVFYDEKGKPIATSEDPILPMGETVLELMRDLYSMFKAFTHPILDWDLISRQGMEPSMHDLKQTKVVLHDWVPPSKEEMRKIELELDKERMEAEVTYKKECCDKTTSEIFQFLGSKKS
jgi:hypothetical protein